MIVPLASSIVTFTAALAIARVVRNKQMVKVEKNSMSTAQIKVGVVN
jgi:hypothetical protein